MTQPTDSTRHDPADVLSLARNLAGTPDSAARAAHTVADALETCMQEEAEAAFKAPSSPDAPAPDHLREHRTGRPPKIDADPDLQAFLRARVDHMTFARPAKDVATHFPPARCTDGAALPAWWKRTLKPPPQTQQAQPGEPPNCRTLPASNQARKGYSVK